MNNTDIAIIIPLYNRVQFIEYTIRSLQMQTYPYWEAIIVDDGSIDGSIALVEKLAREDARIILLKRHRNPKGAPTCRNIGLEYTNCKYILFLDSDDLLAPFCLEKRLAFMKTHTHLDFAVFQMLLFKENIDDIGILWNIATEESDLARFLRMDGVWSISGPIYKKQILISAGGFDESLPFLQDYELHIRVLCSKPAYEKKMNDGPDCYCRRHSGESISQKGFSDKNVLLAKELIFKKIAKILTDTIHTEYYLSISSLLFAVSKEWISIYSNLEESLRCWNFMKSFIDTNLNTQVELYLKQYYASHSQEMESDNNKWVKLKHLEDLLPAVFFAARSYLYLFTQQEWYQINSQHPIISVIIPSYNQGNYLPARIETILNQTFPYFEVTVVDYGSRDDSKAIIEKYASEDKRIHIISSNSKPENELCEWKNIIECAKGTYIWIADPKDYAASNFLLELKRIFSIQVASGAVACQSWQINEDNKLIGLWESHSNDTNKVHTCVVESKIQGTYLLYRNIIPSVSSVLFRKDIFLKSYKEVNNDLQNKWVWARLLLASDILYKAQPLNYFRISSQNAHESPINEGQAIEEISKITVCLSNQGRLSARLQNKVVYVLVKNWVSGFMRSVISLKQSILIYKHLKKLDRKLLFVLYKHLTKQKLTSHLKRYFA